MLVTYVVTYVRSVKHLQKRKDAQIAAYIIYHNKYNIFYLYMAEGFSLSCVEQKNGYYDIQIFCGYIIYELTNKPNLLKTQLDAVPCTSTVRLH